MRPLALAIIPARYDSTRFPGKALALLAGKPMIQHVWERVRRTRGLSRTLVATDDGRIAAAVRAFGGEAVVTGACASGTDRVCEAARGLAADVVLNVQGDEPLIEPSCLEALLEAFADPAVEMATLKRLLPAEEATSPHVVKVVCDLAGNALYFTRSAVPHVRTGPAKIFGHIGVYAYRKSFLERFAAAPRSPLERAEELEQLRALENGWRVRVVETEHQSPGVDTPEDLARVERMLSKA